MSFGTGLFTVSAVIRYIIRENTSLLLYCIMLRTAVYPLRY